LIKWLISLRSRATLCERWLDDEEAAAAANHNLEATVFGLDLGKTKGRGVQHRSIEADGLHDLEEIDANDDRGHLALFAMVRSTL
jgi:hypothetical protein